MSDHSTFPVAGESTSNTSAPTTNGTTMQDVQNTVVNSEVQDPLEMLEVIILTHRSVPSRQSTLGAN